MIDHDDLVDKIINDPDRIPLKGVVGPSPLRELIGFHATTSLPRDLMHDLIEGQSTTSNTRQTPSKQSYGRHSGTKAMLF
ncbi:unnamed protein product [Adineta steineri]|uniref:Uncharacterized protein n=1 Tax=Adineta steineri TaxID=433720 RepID=A0A815PD33_9BILA|nr:unnamed protein product [Adineta steineri]